MLTSKQIEILGYMAEGFSGNEIADLCSISLCTVQRHKEAIYQRLGARSAANAVALAVMRGLLELPRVPNAIPSPLRLIRSA